MKIEFHYESDFRLNHQVRYIDWITRVLENNGFDLKKLNYIFCDDEYLLGINQQYLNHDTYTDIITFDYSEGRTISGDIFISTERIKENASTFKESFANELRRVMIHGVLHIVGFEDKTNEDKKVMRAEEDKSLKMFHVEQ